MSRDLISKITYKYIDHTFVVTRCDTEGIQLSHDGTYTVTLDSVENAPELCDDDDYLKLMFGLFTYWTGYATIHRTASVYLRTIYDIIDTASKKDNTDISSIQNFKLFVDASSAVKRNGEINTAHRSYFHKAI